MPKLLLQLLVHTSHDLELERNESTLLGVVSGSEPVIDNSVNLWKQWHQ